jgi:hypothetical protein
MVEAGLGAWQQTTVGKAERGERQLSLAEAVALSALLNVPLVEPTDAVADAGPAAAGDDPVTAAVRSDVEALGDLVGMEPSLAATALRLAAEVDAGGGEGGRLLPALTRELRATLAALAGGRAPTDDDEDDDLAVPD